MKEIIVLLLILALYVFVSYWVRKLLVKAKSGLFIIVCIGYALFTNYLFDLLIYLQQRLRSKGIYFDFGHAEIELLEVFAICALVGLVNIISVAFKKYKKKRDTPMLNNDAKM